VVTYNTVSVSGNNIFGNASGEVVNVRFTPASFYFDTVNNTEINAPAATATSNNAGAWTVSGIIDPTPAGSGLAWNLTVTDKGTGQTLYTANVQVAFANGSSQLWLALTPPPAPATTTSFLVTPGAQATAAGQFLTSTNAGSSVLSWNFGVNPINVRNFLADPTGVTDSTTAITNAIAAATGNAAPSTHSRVPVAPVYLPTGTYKITSDLLIQSVQGFSLIGDGQELTILNASGSGFTNGPITIDGSYFGRYEGFTIKGDGTEQVNNALTLTYTTGAARSTTSNKFADIGMRNLKCVTGFNAAGVGSRQLDGTKLSNIVLSGGQVQNAWSNSGNWQQGFVFGNGTFANNYNHGLDRCDASGFYYGYYVNASSIVLNGSQPASNYCDFYINPGAQSTITNVQSQNCGQFVIAPSNFAPQPVTFNDIQVKTSYLQGSIIQLAGGTWNFNNFSASTCQVNTTVAAGSNGGQISLVASWAFPSAGVLDVASVANMPAGGGTAFVATSTTQATITYTGVAAGQLTGCAYVSGSATGTVATGGTVNGYVPANISLAGSSSSRPCVVNFSNLALFGTRTGAFTLSNAVVTVQNYSNYAPLTGNYTAAVGDPLSINIGGVWSSVTGVVPPQVNYITATGVTSYTIPAGAQTLDVTIVGGGAGGSSGAYSNFGGAGGGAGGAGGGVSRAQFQASTLTSPVSVTVGAGGNGGAAVTSAAAGNSGIAGSTTAFGNYLWAQGGRASSGGSAANTAAVTGGAGGVGTYVSGQAGGTVTTSLKTTGPTAQSTGGGGGGGGIPGGTTTVAAGSNGGTITNIAAWGTPGAGTLAVAATTNFPTSGTATVATSNTPAVISYAGIAAGQLTGCAYVSGGTGTVATGGAVTVMGTAQNGVGCTAPVMGVSSNSSAGGVVGGASPTNGNAPSAQGDTAPGGGGGAAAIGGSAQQGANGQANTGAGGGGGGASSNAGTTSGAGGAGGSGYALIVAFFQ
jgi:hypothetical protein